jgi:hypothetical protein
LIGSVEIVISHLPITLLGNRRGRVKCQQMGFGRVPRRMAGPAVYSPEGSIVESGWLIISPAGLHAFAVLSRDALSPEAFAKVWQPA